MWRKIVAIVSSRFNTLDSQVVESNDAPPGSAPAPQADFGLGSKVSVFSYFHFNALRARVERRRIAVTRRASPSLTLSKSTVGE